MTAPLPFRPGSLGHDPAIAPLFGRVPVMVPVAQDTLSVRFIPPVIPDDTWLTLSFSFGSWTGACSTSHGIVRMLLRMAEPRPRAPLNAHVAGLLLEMLFAAPLGALEARFGGDFALTGFEPGPPTATGLTRVGFRAEFGAEESFDGLILVPPALLRETIAHGPPLARSLANPPVALGIRIGALVLTRAELDGLRPGAGLVIGRARPDRLVVIAGEYLTAIARYDGHRAICETAFAPAHKTGLVNWTGMNTDLTQASPPDETPMDGLNVPLSFEIGRRVLTLAELRAIGEGHVLEIGPLADMTLSVMANGRRIAEGELVEIGAALAVRITRIVGA